MIHTNLKGHFIDKLSLNGGGRQTASAQYLFAHQENRN